MMKGASLLLAPLAVWVRHASLIHQLARRQLASRYRGSLLGMLWSLLQPLALLAAYTFVFHVVLDARWEQLPMDRGDGGAAAFAVPLFSGLIVFWWAAECLQIGPSVVIHHANYVKKTVFPLPALPYPALLVATLHALISSGVLVGFLLWRGELAVSAWAYPLVLAALAPWLLGGMWLLGAIGVYVRDIQHVVNLTVMLLMFLTPIFYPLSAVPEGWQGALQLNPLTFAVEQVRAALLWPERLDLLALAQFAAMGWALACAGYAVFRWLKRDFADVL